MPLSFTLKPKTLEKMGRAYVKRQQQQLRARQSQRGGRFPRGIKLIDTGRMLKSVQFRIVGAEIEVYCEVPYGAIQDRRFQWWGLNKLYQTLFHQDCQNILNKDGAVWSK